MSFIVPGMILNTVLQPPGEDPLTRALDDARRNGGVIDEWGRSLPQTPVASGEQSPQDYYVPPPQGPQGLTDEALMNDPEVQEFWRRLAQPQVSEEALMLLSNPREVLNLSIFQGNVVQAAQVIPRDNYNPAELKAIARKYSDAFQSTELIGQRLEGLQLLLQQLSGLSKEQKITVLSELRAAWLDIEKLGDWSQSSWDETKVTRYYIQNVVTSGLFGLFMFAAQDPELAGSSIKFALQSDLAKMSGEVEDIFPVDIFGEETANTMRSIVDREQLRQKNLDILLAWQAYARDAYVASQDRYLSLGSGFVAAITLGTHEEGMEEINEYWEIEREILARIEKKLVSEEVVTIDQALLAICLEELENNDGTSTIFTRASWLRNGNSARVLRGEIRGHLIDFGKSMEIDSTASNRLLDQTYHLQAVEGCDGYAYTAYRMVSQYTIEQESWDIADRALTFHDVVTLEEITFHEVAYAVLNRAQNLGAGLVFYVMPFSWGPRVGASVASGLEKVIQSEKLVKWVAAGVNGLTNTGVAAALMYGDPMLEYNPEAL